MQAFEARGVIGKKQMMFPNAREGTIDEPLPCGGESPPFFSYLDCLGWCRQERDSFEIEWQDAVV